MNHYIMGVDIGTSSTKAVLFDQSGNIIMNYAVHYELITDIDGKAEQDPAEIFAAVVEAIQGVMARSNLERDKLKAVSFSAAMHSLILIDNHDKPITNCITWADRRSGILLEHLKQAFHLNRLYERTGTPIHPMSPFAKLCWLNKTAPEKIAQTKIICGIKSYCLYQFFGEWLIDESLASGSGLYNTKAGAWDDEALEIAQVSTTKLPKVVAETYQLKGMSAEWIKQLGLSRETIFVMGGNDGAMANLGIQATGVHDVTVTVGTSGAVRKTTDHFETDHLSRTFCYHLGEKMFVRGGAVNNGGKTIEWALQQFASMELQQTKDYGQLMEDAAKISLGADGLIFLPYLLGERAPFWTSEIRGAFLGLTINHTPAHMIRAVIEGVALNLASVYEAVKAENDVIYVSGGISRHAFWCQLLADVFNRKVFVPHTVEGSSLGAAIIAMYSIGLIDDLKLPKKPKIIASYTPNTERSKKYQSLLTIFEQAATSLKVTNQEIIKWQNEQ
ncbi:gluconokinase [Listeria sp. PSOL-1]|uniref:gluconokinase n=1 Tax=Listeria sp. PSOL-1 TaxID=1844999 RepID=UPI00351B3B55